MVAVVLDDEPQGALGWDGHLLLLHRTEPERKTFLVAWIRHGLVQGEKVIHGQVEVSLPPDIAETLTEQGIDVSAALDDGQLSIESPQDLGRPGRTREIIEQALAEGYRAARISVDSPLVGDFLDGAQADLENMLDDHCRHYPFSALCQYRANILDASVLEIAVKLHAGEIRTAHLITGMDAGRMVVAGELDVTNDTLLTLLLKVVSASASERLVVNLSSVNFMGVAAARALVEGTADFRDAGGRVMLRAPTGDTEWFLRVLGIDEIEHFELSGAA